MFTIYIYIERERERERERDVIAYIYRSMHIAEFLRSQKSGGYCKIVGQIALVNLNLR